MTDTTTEQRECCAIRDELWQTVTGFDFLNDIDRRLRIMMQQLNAADRHQRGTPPDPKSSLPHSNPVTISVLGALLQFAIPLDYEARPVTYEQALSNLCSATAIALAHAMVNGRWAVNEHVRLERAEAALAELAEAVGAFYEYRNDVPPFDDRVVAALQRAEKVLA